MLWDFSFCRTAVLVSSVAKDKARLAAIRSWHAMKLITKPAPRNASNDWNTPKQVFFQRRSVAHRFKAPNAFFGNSLSCGQMQWFESLLKYADISEPSSLWMLWRRPMFLTQVQEHIQSLDISSWQIQPGLPSPTWPAAAGVHCVHPSAEKPLSKPTSHFQVYWKSCKNQQTMELSNPTEHEAF